MFPSITKSQILANKFAYTKDEQVLVPALDLCEELIEAESLRRNYNNLLRKYEALKLAYELTTSYPEYRSINLKA